MVRHILILVGSITVATKARTQLNTIADNNAKSNSDESILVVHQKERERGLLWER